MSAFERNSDITVPASMPMELWAHALERTDTVPDEAEARQEQQSKHDITKMLVVQRVIDARAGPCADQRTWKCDHRESDDLERDEARGGL